MSVVWKWTSQCADDDMRRGRCVETKATEHEQKLVNRLLYRSSEGHKLLNRMILRANVQVKCKYINDYWCGEVQKLTPITNSSLPLTRWGACWSPCLPAAWSPRALGPPGLCCIRSWPWKRGERKRERRKEKHTISWITVKTLCSRTFVRPASMSSIIALGLIRFQQ